MAQIYLDEEVHCNTSELFWPEVAEQDIYMFGLHEISLAYDINLLR